MTESLTLVKQKVIIRRQPLVFEKTPRVTAERVVGIGTSLSDTLYDKHYDPTGTQYEESLRLPEEMLDRLVEYFKACRIDRKRAALCSSHTFTAYVSGLLSELVKPETYNFKVGALLGPDETLQPGEVYGVQTADDQLGIQLGTSVIATDQPTANLYVPCIGDGLYVIRTPELLQLHQAAGLVEFGVQDTALGQVA